MISCSSAPLGPIFSLLTLVAVNQKRDQDILCNRMREDSKGERGARPGLGAVYGLLELKVSGILESMIYSNIQTCCWHLPGVTALQLTLQPVLGSPLVVMNTRLTTLLLLLMAAGREEPILWPPTKTSEEEEPQLFFIKVVPSLSMIVRWPKRQV